MDTPVKTFKDIVEEEANRFAEEKPIEIRNAFIMGARYMLELINKEMTNPNRPYKVRIDENI